jgi:hypothetical protein
MVFLKAIGAGLTVVASLLAFTVAYSAARLYVYNIGKPRAVKAIGLAAVISEPLYWLLVVALVAGEAWLFMRWVRSPHGTG